MQAGHNSLLSGRLSLAQKIKPKAQRESWAQVSFNPCLDVQGREVNTPVEWLLPVCDSHIGGDSSELPLESFVSAKEISICISSLALCLLNTPSGKVSLLGNVVAFPIREGSNQSSAWLKTANDILQFTMRE